MAVEQIEITSRVPFATDRNFAGLQYERIDALVHYAVDPLHPANAPVTDLSLARRDDDGLVRFSGDATLVRPHGGNRGVLLDVPNRGHRVAPMMFHDADPPNDHDIQPGRSLLFDRGYAMAFCGWQWDVPREDGRMGLAAPRLGTAEGAMQIRYQIDTFAPHLALTDQHVGAVGNHIPIEPAPELAREARLLVRETYYGPATELDRGSWDFAKEGSPGKPEPSAAHVWLEGGFEPGLIYDLIYTPRDCPLVGAGMLALRDFAAYLKGDSDPFGGFSHVVGEGVSQCGRLLRTFLYHGMNLDEAGQRAFDGLMIHVAGGRRGEFNHRFGQPSVQPTPGFGHLPPHADLPSPDSPSGLLDRQREKGGLPKIFYTDTSAEYWRGDASLTHIPSAGDRDLDLPENVRRYLFASTQHARGIAPPVDTGFSARGANWYNVVDYRPLMRALLISLFDWVMHDAQPSPSAVPRIDDGSAISRAEALKLLADKDGLALPDADLLNRIRPLDLGAGVDEGVGSFPAKVAGDGLEPRVAALNADGNEAVGLTMPDVEVPIGVHTGFNPRHAEAGATGQFIEYVGSTVFFSRETLESRYADREDYLVRIEQAARAAVTRGHILADDIDWCLELAAARFDAALDAR